MKREAANPNWWSEDKFARLQAQLTGDWSKDSWLLPGVSEKGTPVQRVLDVELENVGMKTELKYVVWYHLTQGTGRKVCAKNQHDQFCKLRHLVLWLKQAPFPVASFLERDLEFWECSLRTWLVQTERYHPKHSKELRANQQYRMYVYEDRHIGLFRDLYQILVNAYDDRPAFEKDIWDLTILGVSMNRSQSRHKLNFTRIIQPWLRALAKQYLQYNLAIHSVADAVGKLAAIQKFSSFLAREAPHTQVSDLNRALILRYLSFLQSENLSDATQIGYLLSLRVFLETCAHHFHIAGLTREALIFYDDLPTHPEYGTREVPEEVLVQLRTHLKSLPTTVLRMVTLLLELGLRISELCQLPLDCLVCDDKHEWYLRCYQSKTHRENVLPLVEEEVIGAIQAQQQDVRTKWGKECHYLFPSPNSSTRPYLQSTFTKKLNRWAVEHHIADRNQQLYHFSAHPFRHTLGMRLINEDVPLEVISRLLGHRSLNMTQVYARIRDKKLRADLERLARKRKTVDYQGHAVKGDPSANTLEAQMTRKGVRGQTLGVGGCGRLVVLGECSYANKCLTCPMWLTSTDDLPALKSFYDRAVRLKQRASEKGNQVVVEQQDRIIPTLVLRIKSLETTEMDGSLCVDDVLAQLRTDLAEAEYSLEEAQVAKLVLAARHLERAIAELKMRIAALEVSDERMHE